MKRNNTKFTKKDFKLQTFTTILLIGIIWWAQFTLGADLDDTMPFNIYITWLVTALLLVKIAVMYRHISKEQE